MSLAKIANAGPLWLETDKEPANRAGEPARGISSTLARMDGHFRQDPRKPHRSREPSDNSFSS
jgi:hypothetical protein